MGGKVQESENLKHAAHRDLNEETDLNLEKQDFKAFNEGKSYRSEADSKYVLNPVLIELSEDKASGEVDLSREHTEHEWIDPEDIEEFQTFKGLKTDLKKGGAQE